MLGVVLVDLDDVGFVVDDYCVFVGVFDDFE